MGIRSTDRRQFLQLAGAAAVGLATATRGRAAAEAEIVLEAGYGRVPILPGGDTDVARFTGEVVAGDPGVLSPSPGYLGPTIQVERGQRLAVHFRNRINGASIVHWHGLHVPFAADGHPQNVIAPGGSNRYDFEVSNRAGLYWYHPHPHEHTGEQVYFGLAGLLVVRDAEERALGLPSGDRESLLVLQDRRFDADNQLHYLGSMMERMNGFLGDRILVNGVPEPTLRVEAGAHRFRLLNGSNSRIYKLGWSDGRPLTVIGNDGGLLEAPVEKPYVVLAPSQRLDVWADLGDLGRGAELSMRSLAFSGAEMTGGMGMGRGGRGRGGRGMGRGRMGRAAGLANGDPFDLFRVSVEGGGGGRTSLPKTLSTIPRLSPSEALQHGEAIPVKLSMGHMAALINGHSFEMTSTAAHERVKLGSRRQFVLENAWDGPAMMSMPHPVHFHGQQFQVVRREAGPHIGDGYSTLREGLVDEGWKDTVLVFPGERVTLVKSFDDFTGLFLYHCHVLEHEDMGMMRNLEVSD